MTSDQDTGGGNKGSDRGKETDTAPRRERSGEATGALSWAGFQAPESGREQPAISVQFGLLESLDAETRPAYLPTV